MNSIFKKFLSQDYKEYLVPEHKTADRFCQKIIHDENSKLFSIDVWLYDFNKIHGLSNAHNPIHVTCEVNFYQSGDKWFVVSLHECENKTISEIELFFSNIYDNLDCIPDIHNN